MIFLLPQPRPFVGFWECKAYNKDLLFSSIVIISREILISGLREITKSSGLTLNVTILSKWKTAAQLTSIIFLFLNISSYSNSYGELIFPQWIYTFSYLLGNLFILIASLLSILSAFEYMRVTKNFMKEKDRIWESYILPKWEKLLAYLKKI